MASDYNEIVHRNFEEMKTPFINFLRRNFKIDYDDIMDIYVNVWIDVRDNIRNGKTERVKSWRSYIFNLGWRQACKFATRTRHIPSFDDENFDSDELESEYLKEKEAEKSIYNDPELKKVLASELSYIPDPCNKILKMYYFDKFSMKEIADSLNYSDARSANVVRNRCRDKIKERVLNAVRRLGILD
ncbi:MAG: sigma-70 family RNA polymerase sigma factor [Muribaculaceae bacterium]|nr:sigma-70 family RNA polymerase sigma factor [Muribaculaceae bacterium]